MGTHSWEVSAGSSWELYCVQQELYTCSVFTGWVPGGCLEGT